MKLHRIRICLFLLEFFCLFVILVAEDSRGQSEMVMRDINDVMQSHTEELMSIPGVVGVYIGALGDGTPCIKVMVVEKTPELESKIPSVLEGYPLVIVESGEIRPLSSP